MLQKWVVVVSITLLIVKFIAYFHTGSVAILTDAMESIVNVIAAIIGLYSLYISAKPRDSNHPYGHGKAEFLSAAIEGLLVALSGIFILYEALQKLLAPVDVHRLDLGIILISITAAINYAMGMICVAQGKKHQSPALEASGKHLKTDTYSTLVVVAGLMVLYFTKTNWIDAAIAIVLSLFIVYTAYHIIRKSVAGIMDEADTALLTDMITLINNHRRSNWVDLHNLRVIKYGSILHVDAHLTVPWYFSVKEAHHEVEIFSDIIRQHYGASLELFIHFDNCLEEEQCPICIKTDCWFRKQNLVRRVEWNLENVVKNKKHHTQNSSLIL